MDDSDLHQTGLRRLTPFSHRSLRWINTFANLQGLVGFPNITPADGSPCLLPGLQLCFLRLPDPHLAALTLHPSEDRFQLDQIRSSQLPPEFALDRGRDQVRFPASPESCDSSLTCTSALNVLRVPHARQAAHAFPVFNSSLPCCPCRYDSLA